MARKRIGELLLEQGAITRAQLEEGLAHQRTTRQRLGLALVQRGFITEEELAQALAAALAIPLVDLATAAVDPSAVQTLRPRFCESNDLFPYALDPGAKGRKQLSVAMADPLNLSALEEIEFTTGFAVSARIAPVTAIRAAILRYYHKVVPDEVQAPGMMTLVNRGGGARVVDTRTQDPSDDEVIVGEEVTPTDFGRRLPKARPAPSSGGLPSNLSQDLDFLFGREEEGSQVEALERKFWALLRVMARKGLITKEEFTRELDEQD